MANDPATPSLGITQVDRPGGADLEAMPDGGDDRYRPRVFRRGWLIFVAGLAAIAIAIGAVTMIRTSSISDRDLQEARASVNRYLDAYQRHDGQAICAELILKVREELAGGNDPRACAQELSRRSRLLEIVPPIRPRASVMRDASHSDRIAVLLEWPGGSGVGLGMQHVGGRWLLDTDETCVTPTCQP